LKNSINATSLQRNRLSICAELYDRKVLDAIEGYYRWNIIEWQQFVQNQIRKALKVLPICEAECQCTHNYQDKSIDQRLTLTHSAGCYN